MAVALAYLQSGLSLLPVSTDGTKARAWPLLPKAWDDRQGREQATWKPYQTRQPTPDEVQAWCSHRVGLGIIGGRLSGNLDILDFDDPALFAPWCDMVKELAPGLVQRLPLVKTPSEGRHLYYRCQIIAGNTKLAEAMTSEGTRGKTLIETRGESGYTLSPVCPPTCHVRKKPYQLIDGDLTDIPTITPDERMTLWQGAQSLNQYVEPERTISYEPKGYTMVMNDDRPGDAYNVRATWDEILLPHGWRVVGQRGEVTLGCRPGKEHGLGATSGWNGTDMLYVFSTNAPPFEAERGYSKFTAYALLYAAGDFMKAATMLAHQGYVSRYEGPGAGGIHTTRKRQAIRTVKAGEVPSWRP